MIDCTPVAIPVNGLGRPNCAVSTDAGNALAGFTDGAAATAEAFGSPSKRESSAAVAEAPPPTVQPAEPFTLTVRAKGTSKGEAITFTDSDPYTAFKRALTQTASSFSADAEPMLEWTDFDAAAVVDEDYHNTTPPGREVLGCRAALVRPGAAIYWVTHGGGLRLVYFAGGGLTAREWATLAKLYRRADSNSGTISILNHTRHPRYTRARNGVVQRCGEPVFGGGDSARYTGISGDVDRIVNQVLGTVNDTDADGEKVQEWLDENGWRRDGRYPHSRCLIDPMHQSTSADPVQVGEKGIYCHSCNGRTGRGGFVPFARLTLQR